MCYVGRLKGSMYLVNARLVVRNTQGPSKYEAGPQKCCQQLANRWEGGAIWGPIPLGGRNAMYVCMDVHV